MFVYKTKGVCSTEIHIQTKDDVIESVEFINGCPGNLFGISTLVKGMKINEAIEKLSGIKCKTKDTSCPDQLALALKTLQEA
ncbi:TIGR03905 family TSCPD domain-containing protein [uncultured Clostridium sp.]|uniref:TIGR03905 family TSCPD domain-containing protein n=1 Tax=uncultured Clostridium sp. TaxID=59620 RepID=UPI002605E44A|nr:TIGR03905 family TSCPD domain-containing protein [uncultured Clostridium sp.]